ncbi:MAG: 4Fe-4S binding protein [Phycisphaerae bacterium]
MPTPPNNLNSRREFLGILTRGSAAIAVGGVLGALLWERRAAEHSTDRAQKPTHAGHHGTGDKDTSTVHWQDQLPSSLPAHATVWQIDPLRCIQCGKCATACVLTPSAVKCFHAHAICGYCDLCTGYFEAQAPALNTAAENQQCPTAAIKRKFVEDPYYEYVIDQPLCIGCAKCVKGCNTYGNGSLYLQIEQHRCVGCNQCAIGQVCPSGAIQRVAVQTPYIATKVRGT